MAKRGLKLKLPLPKKPIIKGVPNTYLAAGGLIAGAGGLYYAYTQGWLPEELTSLIEGVQSQLPVVGGTGQAVQSITLSVQPTVVRPDSTIMISGMTTPAITGTLHYYVYEDIQPRGGSGRILKQHGMVNVTAGAFSQSIPTTLYREGTYTVLVSDTEIADPQAASAVGGSTIVGAQNQTLSPTTDQYSGALTERTDEDYVFDVTQS